jgi:hypothetical protein
LLNGEQANFSSTITVMVIQFPDDDYGDGPWNVGLHTIEQCDMGASPRIFY